MSSFFPTPYPDEIFCSVLARYHIRSGNTSPKVTLQELFNSPNIRVRADLPYQLTSLIENLPLLSNYTVKGLIQKHTVYPLYAVFMPDRKDALYQYMKGELGTYVYRGTVHAVNLPRYFRFCHLCFAEDLQKYGEAYWHRLHQTPGVLVCPVHAVALSDSTALQRSDNWHEKAAASLDNCQLGVEQKNYSEDTLQKLLLLALDLQSLMTRDLCDLPCKELDWFHVQYIVRLIQLGLATIDRWVYEQDLLESFLDFYGREFIEVLGIKVDNPFLFEILRLSPSVFDPVMHLLMIRFLTNSVEKFFAGKLKYKPFGKAPWPCLNPACEHYLKFVVTHLTMHSSREPDSPYSYIENPLGTFSCGCGFIYTRRGADTTELDKFRFETIEAYGQLWSQKYLESAETDRRRFEETALKLSCNYGCKSPNKMLRRLEAFWKSLNNNSEDKQDG